MNKIKITIVFIIISICSIAQMPYEQMREKLLKNEWVNSDYEIYMSEYNLQNNKDKKFDSPAYFVNISDETKQLISNATVFYPNANCIYHNGKKRLIDSANRLVTVKKVNGKLLLPKSLIYSILEDDVEINKTKSEWVEIETIARKLGKNAYSTSLGLLIIANNTQVEFENLSRTNQYEILYNTLFERPNGATIVDDLTNNTHGEHPYLLANKKRFEEIKKLIKTDDFAKNCYNSIIKSAEKKINKPGEYSYEYDNPLGGPFASLKVKIDIFDLIMAYSLTGEKKYADRAWQDMDAISKWPDWGNSKGRQFLRTAGISFQMALGYDWLYNYLTPDKRTQIKESIVEKAIRPGLFYHMYRDSRIVVSKSNWNAVCNHGLLAAALAVALDEPELSSRMLWFSTGSLENVLSIYAPDGAYDEGPLYWAFGTGALVRALNLIETATGHSYGLGNAPGMEQTAYFLPNMIAPTGYFNFHDAVENNETKLLNSEYFWFANRYTNPEFYYIRMNKPEQQSGKAYDLLWYTGKPKGSFDLKLDYMGSGENNAVGTGAFRSSWTDPNALYLGFHASYCKANHSQADEGTFVFDAMGERWIMDVGDGRMDLSPDGKTIVNANKYFGKERPLFYRVRTEGQNCYVINPNESLGQDFTEKNRPQFEKLSMYQPDKAFAITNISCAYKGQVESAKRGFMLDRKNKFALIQDEVTCSKPSTIYSFIHTRAHIQLVENEKAAIFSIGNKRMYVKLIGNTENAKLTVMEAKGLLPTAINMKQMDDVRKFAIKFDNVTTMNIAIVCIPMNEIDSKPKVNTEFKNLSDWK